MMVNNLQRLQNQVKNQINKYKVLNNHNKKLN